MFGKSGGAEFIMGAKWADKTMVEKLFAQACVFLSKNATIIDGSNINIHINGGDYHFVSDFINDLYKTMQVHFCIDTQDIIDK